MNNINWTWCTPGEKSVKRQQNRAIPKPIWNNLKIINVIVIRFEFLPHIDSSVTANSILLISKAPSAPSFASSRFTSFSIFSLKIGINEFKMLLLNVRLINFLSFFHMCATFGGEAVNHDSAINIPYSFKKIWCYQVNWGCLSNYQRNRTHMASVNNWLTIGRFSYRPVC